MVRTTLPIEGKLKDTIKNRIGMKEMGTCWWNVSVVNIKKGHTNYTFKPDGKKRFLKWLQSVNLPDGYTSNISTWTMTHCHV